MSNVETLPVAKHDIMAGGTVKAIVPQSFDDCYRLARLIVASGMAPAGMESPEKVTIAIMHGMEVGLTPLAALQRIAVINGRPTIWGDAAIGLVRGSGKCEYVKEWIDGEIAYCETKRKGETASVTRTFSVADAKTAKLWGKAGPWQQYPQRMLQMRARAFCLRDVYADILGGMYLREELDDVPMRDVTPPKSSAQAKKDGDWQKFEAEFAACNSVEEVLDLHDSLKADKTIPKGWREPINDLRIRRVEELKASHPLTKTKLIEQLEASHAQLDAEESEVNPIENPDDYMDGVIAAMHAATRLDRLKEIWDEHSEIAHWLMPPDRDAVADAYLKNVKRLEK